MYPNNSDIVSSDVLNEIAEKNKEKPGILLTTLEAAQEANIYKYLPPETLTEISKILNVPLTQVYSVATFYSFFNLKPQGKHSIIVCRGTACHTKGSKALLGQVGQILGFRYDDEDDEPSFTTPDNEFTIKTVACFGQCAQSPVLAIDNVIYSNVNSLKLLEVIRKIQGKKTKE